MSEGERDERSRRTGTCNLALVANARVLDVLFLQLRSRFACKDGIYEYGMVLSVISSTRA